VDGIDLEVHEGEIFGILGPNGAGKTTTLEMIEGLRKPDAGSIRLDGFDAIGQTDDVRKIIGVQLQTTALFPYLSASELIELFANLYEVPNAATRAPELLKLVNLEEKAGSRVEELSGGQQQRLSIALALVNNPRVTFLDEPTTGLDPHARRSLWETILGVRKAGTTVVLTTHYMEEAEVLCDRIAIMDGGRVIACDTPAGLIRDLALEATVSASIAQGTISEDALRNLPGVVSAALALTETPPRLRLQTGNAQATITALLELSSTNQVLLDDLSSTRATLEDVFLARTGRTYEQTTESPPAEEAHAKRGRRRAA
jgi:ABC-2 type transport system ATP-binding protein